MADSFAFQRRIQNTTFMKPVLLRQALCAWLLLLFALPLAIQAQESVSGFVISQKDQQPIANASVLIKGSQRGTSTNERGHFSLSADPGDVFIISGVGIQTTEIAFNGGSTITVTVNQLSNDLNEVVVTALGVKKEIKRIGYAIQEIKGEELVKARDQNPITGLTGKIAGLSVGPSAEMLRKPTVLLRGSEITLYVVDGVPISSDTWNISPDDIESYTILKGPAAAALYGSRAASGAIVISTKKGGKGTKGWQVDLNSTNSFDKGFVAFPRLQDEYGPGENGLYAFGNGLGGGLNDADYDVWGPRFEGQQIPQWDGEYTPNQTYETKFPGGLTYTGNIKPSAWTARGKDNLGRFLRTGFQSTNNISLSSTGDNYTLRFSLSHSYQASIVPNTKLNITGLNVYGSYNVSKRLKIEANVNINRQYTPNFPDVDYGPNSLIYSVGIWTGADWDVQSPLIKGIWQPGKVGTQSVFAEYQRYHNPWFTVKEWLRGHYKTDIYSYLSTNYKINDHLNATLRSQITTYNLLRTEKMPYSAHPYGREGNKGDYREDRRNLFENNTELMLNYNYEVGNFLNLAGLVGGNARNFSYNSNFTTTDYLNVPGVYAFSNSLNPVQANSFSSNMLVLSAYGSLDASFSKYATLSATARVDKSSALPVNNNSYFYPSLSLSTVLSDYIKLPTAISFLKLRGSFASVRDVPTSQTIGMAPFSTITSLGASPSGNSLYDYPLGYGNNYLSPYGGPDFSLASAYSTSKPYNSQTAAYYTSNLFDPNIKSSRRVAFEQGLDIKFLQNRLGLSATMFQYIDGPRILSNPISSATGYNYYYINALKTKKTGYEFSLQGAPLKSKAGVNWDVLVNYATYKDVYYELPPGQDVYDTYYRNGDRVDKFYGSAFVRTQDGKIINDAAGKPISNPKSQFLGYLNGKVQWSIFNRFSYRGLGISFQFDGNVGGVTSDYLHNKTMRGGRNIETVQGAFGVARKSDSENAGDTRDDADPNKYKGIYVGEGVQISNGASINYDGTTGAVLNYKDLQFAPNQTTTQVQDYISKYYGVTEANLMSKSFAKLRELSISYDLPASVLKKSFISKVTVSLVGRNLVYFYKDKRFKDVDLDQYNYSTTGTSLQTPTMRRFGFNINVSF